jgi:hypothetical protein
MVDDDTILDVIERDRGDLDGAAKELVNAANRNGGEDNITVVFFEVVEEGAQAPSETKPMPALDDEPAAEPDVDEDTLDETDRVPAVDTMIVPPEQAREMAAARHAEPPEPKQHIGVQAARMVIALAVVAGLLLLVIWLLGQSQ